MNIIDYHDATKHHYQRFAKSLGYMDWANQPEPFRYFEGRSPIQLPLLEKDPKATYMDLYSREKNLEKPFSLKNIAGFLELSLGLSAWKGIPGSRWSLRINPSSGNLHPTEVHLVLPAINGTIDAGVYHYNAFLHALEPRAVFSGDLWEKIERHFQTKGFIVAASSIFWRESWKYGERAFRYCNHDAGHALACLSFSANLFGWKVLYLNALSDDDIETLLGFDRTAWPPMEKEHPDFLCYVLPSSENLEIRSFSEEILKDFAGLNFFGTPNCLSQDHYHWEKIESANLAVKKPRTRPVQISFDDKPYVNNVLSKLPAAKIIRQRRSALGFNPDGSADLTQFLAMLDKTLPRNNGAPFDVQLLFPCVHLLLFVHNVKGLNQGLYFFLRNSKDINTIRVLSRPEFLWKTVKQDFPLYLLQEGNFRQTAARVSCYQDIGGQSAFSLGMIASFQDLVEKNPYFYRYLFWETGMIGQVLYLEAEAHGLRGTGIGCFFDDAVHDILGFEDNQFQSLYHFTVGEHIEDRRLKTLPPYYHIEHKKGS
ncbi:MAG: SagB/ThcOx family dehydrogenase [Desulfobacterales bacterium]